MAEKRKSVMAGQDHWKKVKVKEQARPKSKENRKRVSPILNRKFESRAKGGRAGFQHGGRTNLLEELGRVEGEHSNRNRRAEVSRIHGELNKGYSLGGRVGAAKRGFNKKILRKD
jgi:hypothetical protein